jgi:hypothetical protein
MQTKEITPLMFGVGVASKTGGSSGTKGSAGVA